MTYTSTCPVTLVLYNSNINLICYMNWLNLLLTGILKVPNPNAIMTPRQAVAILYINSPSQICVRVANLKQRSAIKSIPFYIV